MNTNEEVRRRRNATISLVVEYYNTYIDRSPCFTSSFIGDKWVGELLSGHSTRFSNMFRMTKEVFTDLLANLTEFHGLHWSSKTTQREVLAITLYMLSQNESMRAAMKRFQHSSETISRYFSAGLDALVNLSKEVIKPTDPTFAQTPVEIQRDARYMPFFKDCIGAIDGTHVDERVTNDEKIAFIGRCGARTQNVMTVCDFNMCFTFVLPGWEGSAHDSRIFKGATQNPHYNFPHPPHGKYYVVDAAYPLQRGYLKPFPDTRYLLPDFQRADNIPRGRKELFNKRHSSLRGVIERTFGVWKKKWVILRDMPAYPFPKQVKIVIATMTLHNFIRWHPSRSDIDFYCAEDNRQQVLPEAFEYHIGHSMPQDDNDPSINCTQVGDGANEMTTLRERITTALERAYL